MILKKGAYSLLFILKTTFPCFQSFISFQNIIPLEHKIIRFLLLVGSSHCIVLQRMGTLLLSFQSWGTYDVKTYWAITAKMETREKVFYALLIACDCIDVSMR